MAKDKYFSFKFLTFVSDRSLTKLLAMVEESEEIQNIYNHEEVESIGKRLHREEEDFAEIDINLIN